MAFQDKERQGRPSPLACIECRKKHLKCDAAVPVCARCISKGLNCSYTPSRRGIAGRSRRLQSPRHTPPLPSTQTSNVGQTLRQTHSAHTLASSNHSLSDAHGSSTWSTTGGLPRTDAVTTTPSPAASTPSDASGRSSLRSEDEHLTNLFYSHFHSSHPVLVPRYRLSMQDYPEYLRTVIKFVGSHYAPNISSDSLRASVVSIMTACEEKSPEAVQAYLLYAMALHARYEPMEAMQSITKAAELAIELGLNHAGYATSHAHGDTVYEESLRRTWWEVYVTDGYLASLHRHTSFKSNTVMATTLLPCEEAAYNDGSIPSNPLAFHHYDARLFSDEETNFSSFTYRIDAIRILSRVMAVSSTNEAHADAIQTIDNAIASWKVHLPNDKASILTPSGETDEMIFQANLFIQIASIFLHFPRSELPITMPPAAEIACAQQHMEQVSPTSTQHAVKSINASKDIANLAALPIERHSPFFICGLVFACIVQLSACSAYPRSSAQQNRDRVALMLGHLKSFSRNWAIARYVSQQLKRAANEIFNPQAREEHGTPATGGTGSTYDSAIDLGSFPTDVSWLDLFYNDGLQLGSVGAAGMGEGMTGLEQT